MEETMRYFTYGGKSYYFDVSEVGCLTRLTGALERMEEERTERGGGEKEPAYAVIASFCASILTFFEPVVAAAGDRGACRRDRACDPDGFSCGDPFFRDPERSHGQSGIEAASGTAAIL